jgi:hypothetical protein
VTNYIVVSKNAILLLCKNPYINCLANTDVNRKQ